MTLTALSVRQPWASLLLSGRKTVEVRSRPTKHRGPLLICASKSRSLSADAIAAVLRLHLDIDAMPRGVALGTVDVVDCRPMLPGDAEAACCPFEAGMCAWVVKNPQPCEPFSVSGRLGLFLIACGSALTMISETNNVKS